MLKFRLIPGNPGRLRGLIEGVEFEIETSRLEKTLADEFGEKRDDSPTDDMDVIRARKQG